MSVSKRASVGLLFILGCLLGMQVHAAPITRDIVGSITAAAGTGADAGAGTVTGFVTYDDAFPLFDLGTSAFFLADAFNLMFSNGPTITEADTSLEVQVDAGSGNLLSILVDFGFFGPLTGFGLTGLTLNTDGFTTDLFFDVNFSSVVEGSVAFVPLDDGAMPNPSSLALLALGGLLAARRAAQRS